MATDIPSTGFLRLPQVLELFPHQQERMVERLRNRTLSQACKIGPRTTVWRAEDIRAFIENAGKEGGRP